MDFWEAFFDLLGDMFGEWGILFAPLTLLVIILICYFGWWEFIR